MKNINPYRCTKAWDSSLDKIGSVRFFKIWDNIKKVHYTIRHKVAFGVYASLQFEDLMKVRCNLEFPINNNIFSKVRTKLNASH